MTEMYINETRDGWAMSEKTITILSDIVELPGKLSINVANVR